MISVCNESLICNCDSAEILRPQHFVVVCELTSIHDNILFSIKLDLQESQGFDKIAEFFLIGQASRARPGRFFLTTGRDWPYWPAFYFTGQNSQSGPKLARSLSLADRPRPLPALFIFA